MAYSMRISLGGPSAPVASMSLALKISEPRGHTVTGLGMSWSIGRVPQGRNNIFAPPGEEFRRARLPKLTAVAGHYYPATSPASCESREYPWKIFGYKAQQTSLVISCSEWPTPRTRANVEGHPVFPYPPGR